MVFNTEFNHDHKIELAIDMLSQCNAMCSYCYFNGDIPPISLNMARLISRYVAKNENTIDITLMGGEPTLHPLLTPICDIFRSTPNVDVITVYTNGIRRVSIPDYAVVHMSYHPTEVDDDVFIQNAHHYAANHIVRIMLVMVPSKYERILKVFNKLRGFEIVPIYIVRHNRVILPPWTIDGIDRKNISYMGQYVSARELCETRTNFAGCRCHMNMYTVHGHSVIRECVDCVVGDISDIPKLTLDPIICTNDRCAVTCWQDVTKECT